MELNPNIFREYDIRGITPKDLNEAAMEWLGKAYATYLQGHITHNRVAIGRDGRLTSEPFSRALIAGITSAGIDVIDLGEVPTPLVYFALFTQDVDGGIMITGSHNPKEYNGMKVAVGKSTIHGSEIQALGQIAQKGAFTTAEKPGTVTKLDIVPAYHARVLSDVKLARKLKVVVDAGNGVGGKVAVPLFQALGCDVVPLFCDVDGNFPNHHPDPTLAASLTHLIETVKREKADLGLAYDGDGDRIGAVDENGEVIYGDRLLILFARSVLKDVPGAAVIGEVKCSRTLYQDIEKHGGKAVMWKTGHSLIKDAMKKFDAQLAGEMSGHMFFKHRWYGFDDAIYSSARLLEFLARGGQTLSDHLSSVPKTFSTEEIRIPTTEERKFGIVDAATRYFKDEMGLDVNDIDGARIEFPDGWGLIRASNTSPMLVMRCEADTEARLQEICELVQDKVSALNA